MSKYNYNRMSSPTSISVLPEQHNSSGERRSTTTGEGSEQLKIFFRVGPAGLKRP